MQSLADDVVGALASISSAVGEVQGFVDGATHSMQEQSMATEEISASMHIAATGVAAIGRNLDDWIIGMEERRFDARERVSKPAVIHLPNGRTIHCSLRNISRSGAKLILAEAASVPERFQLEVVGEPGTRPCIVARRGDGEIGARFVD